MIWNYFPIGMSFPVTDFSLETKRRCWQITLSALAAAGDYAEMALYDNCAKQLPGSAEKEYVCIMNHRHVTQSRVNCAVWSELSRLNAHLSLHYPYYQANALDNFGPYVELAKVAENGSVYRSKEGLALLPDHLPEAMPRSSGKRALVAFDATPTALGYTAAMRAVGLAAAEHNWSVSYCPLAHGGIGTAYALVYRQRGRFEWLKTENADGTKMQLLLGVLPKETVVFDCAALLRGHEAVATSEALGKAIQKVLNLGYRNLLLPMVGYADADGGEAMQALLCNPEAPDPRLAECRITLLCDGKAKESGTVKFLLKLGATAVDASLFLSEALGISERCRHTGLAILGTAHESGVSDAFVNACSGHTPLWTAEAIDWNDPDGQYRHFTGLFAAYGAE